MGYPFKTHPKLKAREIYFARFLLEIVLKLCTTQGSDSVVLCVQLQYDGTTETDFTDIRNFTGYMNSLAEYPNRKSQHDIIIIMMKYASMKYLVKKTP